MSGGGSRRLPWKEYDRYRLTYTRGLRGAQPFEVSLISVDLVALEEGVRERHRVELRHPSVLKKLGIDVEEDGHIDRLAREQSLLVKAEALYLVEVGARLPMDTKGA